jgi:hypothetical protein
MAELTPNPWHPMTNPVDVKHLGKLAEEAAELAMVSSRCIIQGIEEKQPITDKPNKQWLEDEIADVLVGIELVSARFNLDIIRIDNRCKQKIEYLRKWHEMA